MTILIVIVVLICSLVAGAMAIVVGGAEEFVPTALLETSGETNGDEFQAPRVGLAVLAC